MSDRTTIAIPRALHKRLKLLSVHQEEEIQETANKALELGLQALETPASTRLQHTKTAARAKLAA